MPSTRNLTAGESYTVKAILALEDGSIFEGRSVGAEGESFGELVFNTSMTGYQEILTDPSYAGQIITMTYTQIGNYGVNEEDVESRQPFCRGFVMRECCFEPSNWRATMSLPDYLKKHDIVAIDQQVFVFIQGRKILLQQGGLADAPGAIYHHDLVWPNHFFKGLELSLGDVVGSYVN